MILIIDNYDSFVYNLARYVSELGCHYLVTRNDAITIAEIKQLNPSHIILSPGPCTPLESGICRPIVEQFYTSIPILGVCLGHQVIGAVFGAKVQQAKEPLHGQASLIEHTSQKIFTGLNNPLQVARYHSLIVTTAGLPTCLEITAISAQQEIMALQHKDYPVFGVQFHPESILTQQGHKLLQNFIAPIVG